MANYAPSQSSYNTLLAWAQAQGFQVATYTNNIGLSIVGSVGQVERAFYVNLVNGTRPDGTTFYEPDRPPSVQLSVTLLGVSGLDDYFVPVPATSFENYGGAGNSLASNDVRDAYLGVNSACSSLDGSGQTVGLVGFNDFLDSDIALYRQLTGLPAVPTSYYQRAKVPISPAVPLNPKSAEPWLDVEAVMAMAPNAHVIAFQDKNNIDPVLALISQPTFAAVKQVSISYAIGSYSSTTQSTLLLLASQGKTVFTSSGDNAAWQPPGATCPPADVAQMAKDGGLPAPGVPASFAFMSLNYLTIVGGTNSQANGSPAYNSETAWTGSAGGIMAPIPSSSTAGVTIPSYQAGPGLNPINPQISTQWRMAPDVSAFAQNIFIVDSSPCPMSETCPVVPNGPVTGVLEGQATTVGGTSASTPFWAAFVALMNQFRTEQPIPSVVGYMNPTIYGIGRNPAQYAADFHDISDKSEAANTCGFGYLAYPGYDMVTGWGSPACGLITGNIPQPTALSAGSGTACAVDPSGVVYCWGDNTFGQLGDGTMTSRATPAPVTDVSGVPLSNVASVTVGGGFACALTTAGAVLCWGYDADYELGDAGGAASYVACGSSMGLVSECSTHPGPVVGLGAGSAIAVSAGENSACAVTVGGGVLCWGDDTFGQLGDNQTLSPLGGCSLTTAGDYCSQYPIPVTGLAMETGGGWAATQLPLNNGINLGALGTSVAVSVGTDFACAVVDGGQVYCWGSNAFNQLGTQGYDQGCPAGTPCSDISPAVCPGGFGCALTPLLIPNLHDAAPPISAGAMSTCVETTEGGVKCWGDNQFGELGGASSDVCQDFTAEGGIPCSAAPISVPSLAASSVSVGNGFACAISRGGVVCWGDNAYGMLGDGMNYYGSNPPVPVTGLGSDITAVAAGNIESSLGFACALGSSSGISCWGDNSDGELGPEAGGGAWSSIPLAVTVP